MGFRISWIGLKDIEAPKALALAGLRDTEEVDEASESFASWTTLPANWVIIFYNDFNYPSDEFLQLLSAGCSVLSAQIHEGIMYSGIRYHDHGEELWSVSHDCENGIYDVDVSGEPPSLLTAIRDRLTAKQRDAGERCGVDYVFDVPVELAEAMCGYRHDRWRFEWGKPIFRKAEPISRG